LASSTRCSALSADVELHLLQVAGAGLHDAPAGRGAAVNATSRCRRVAMYWPATTPSRARCYHAIRMPASLISSAIFSDVSGVISDAPHDAVAGRQRGPIFQLVNISGKFPARPARRRRPARATGSFQEAGFHGTTSPWNCRHAAEVAEDAAVRGTSSCASRAAGGRCPATRAGEFFGVRFDQVAGATGCARGPAAAMRLQRGERARCRGDGLVDVGAARHRHLRDHRVVVRVQRRERLADSARRTGPVDEELVPDGERKPAAAAMSRGSCGFSASELTGTSGLSPFSILVDQVRRRSPRRSIEPLRAVALVAAVAGIAAIHRPS